MTPAAAALLKRIERAPVHADLVPIVALVELWEHGHAVVHGRYVWAWSLWTAHQARRRARRRP